MPHHPTSNSDQLRARWPLLACVLLVAGACGESVTPGGEDPGSTDTPRSAADAATGRDVDPGRDPDDFGVADAGTEGDPERDDDIDADESDGEADDESESEPPDTDPDGEDEPADPECVPPRECDGATCDHWEPLPSTVDIVDAVNTPCTGESFRRFNHSYGLWVGARLCNSERYALYLAMHRDGPYYSIGDTAGHGQDHCELVNPDFRILNDDVITSGGCDDCDIRSAGSPGGSTQGFYRSNYGGCFNYSSSWRRGIHTAFWYECGVSIPGAGTP